MIDFSSHECVKSLKGVSRANAALLLKLVKMDEGEEVDSRGNAAVAMEDGEIINLSEDA